MAEHELRVSDVEHVMHWDDVHGDPLDIGIERDPVEWPDPEDQLGEARISQPVIFVSGDAYLTPYEARQAAEHLLVLADRLTPDSTPESS